LEAILKTLNEAQLKPVLHKDGPLMVIAGAGSGKTRVLTFRIANLMHQGVDAFNILALTFTNKAAREMKNRIGKIVGNTESKNLWMGTFHAIFAKILRFESGKLGFPSNFTIYDTQDSLRLITTIIKEMQLDKEVYKPKQVLNRISTYKNNLITVRAYLNDPELMEADAMSKKPRLGEVYHNYVERCFKAGAMDFDDLLLRTNELLTRFPEVLMKYQNRFRYILVDEYQDTNHSQYLIVKMLSDRFQNICVVGDDSQSIYAFRGANIQNIFNFQKDYENVAVYRLEQNYRSTKNIVEAANSLIDKNKQRLEKVIWTHNEDGDQILVKRLLTDAEEGRFVASTIFENKMNLQMYNRDFAVLYRTNAQSRSIEDALRKQDIPYRIFGGLSFYQRKEIKDVVAYLRLVINPNDEEALVRVINYPARGIGDTTLEKLTVAANHYKRSIFEVMQHLDKIDLKLNKPTIQRLEDFVTMLQSFQVLNQTYDAFDLASHVARKSGLLQELKKDGTPEGISRIDNIEELLNGIKDFIEGQKEVEGTTGSLTEFLEDISLASDLDKGLPNEDKVSLMTIHMAKGLEFPHVFIVGLEEDLFPSAMSLNSRSDLEEERRLFYVALTRAEKRAYLSFAQSRYRWGKLTDAEPSRFIEEIDDKYLDFQMPDNPPRFKHFMNNDIFGEPDLSKLRLSKPVAGTPPKGPNQEQIRKLRKLKPGLAEPLEKANLFDNQLVVGNIVTHERFGKGEILALEGTGSDRKAVIKFEAVGVKNLLLRFAKLNVMG